MIDENENSPRENELLGRIADFWSSQLNNEIFVRDHPGVSRGSKEYFDLILAARRKYISYLPKMVEFLEHGPDKTLLEVGCGMGTDTLVFASSGFRVTGADLAPAHLQLAKRLFDHYGARGTFLETNAETLPFTNEAFGGVYSFGVLHHTPDTARAIREIHRVLKPGGRSVLMLYNRNSLNNFVHWITGRGFENARKKSGTETDAPITYRFTKSEVLRMCSMFEECKIDTEYLYGAGWGKIHDMTPRPIYRALSKALGWHLVIYLTK